MSQTSQRCFCAFCKSERSIYSKQHVSVIDVFFALFASLLLMLLIWQTFDPRVFVFMAIAVGVSELFVMMRRRLSLSCRRCGFDPVLYKTDPKAAAERVKSFMSRQQEDPMSLFVPPPKLPVLRKSSPVKRTL
jgi:hypothetical protein